MFCCSRRYKKPNSMSFLKQPAAVSSVTRLLQWNVLADGLGQDGFLSTEFHPIRESDDKDAKAFAPPEFLESVRAAKAEDTKSGVMQKFARCKKLRQQLRELRRGTDEYAALETTIAALRAETDRGALARLRTRFRDSPELARVETEILAWDVRFARLKRTILRADPDIVTLQELDHVRQFVEDPVLAALYTCHVDDGAAGAYYAPARYHDDDADRDDLRPEHYADHVLNSRVAFAPKSYSTARDLRTKLLQQQQSPLQQDDAESIVDDDGVAIFWKKKKYRAVELGVLRTSAGKKKSSAVVTVVLEHRTTMARTNVLTTHLPAGDNADKERERLLVLKDTSQISEAKRIVRNGAGRWDQDDYGASNFDGLLSYVQHYVDRRSHDASMTVLALDANSRPTFPLVTPPAFSVGAAPPAGTNVWRSFLNDDAAGLRSVWVGPDLLQRDGTASDPNGAPYLVSCNKMRGPSSDQPEKIGEHQCELIDHVWTNATRSAVVTTVGVTTPQRYGSKEEAALTLFPTTDVPSDHLPVLVDLWSSNSSSL